MFATTKNSSFVRRWSGRVQLAAASAVLIAALPASSVFAGAGNDYCVKHKFNITTLGNLPPEVIFSYRVYAFAQTNTCKDKDDDKGSYAIGAGGASEISLAYAPNSWADSEAKATITALAVGNVAGEIEANGNADPDWQGCPWGALRGWGVSHAYSTAAVKVRGKKEDKKGNIKYAGSWKHVPPVVGSSKRGVSRDPIVARLIDNTTGEVLEWTLLSFNTSSADGQVAWFSDALSNTSTNMSMHIKLGAAITTQQGELKVEIKDGIVTEMLQLGLFSAMPLPAVGSPGSFSVPMPELSIDFDMGGDDSHDLTPELDMDNAGDVEKEAAGESNGSLTTDLSTGYDDTNVSEVPVGDSVYGFGTQLGNQHLADDFTVPMGPPVALEVLRLPVYQTNSSESMPVFGAFVRIWLGQPGEGGSPIAGDMFTNRLIETQTSILHRVAGDHHNNQRRIKDLVIDMTWAPQLPPGQYWVEIATQGNQSFGSVNVPPTVWATEADNAQVYSQQFNSWQPLVDTGSGRSVGLPMTMYGLGLGAPLCQSDVNGSGTTDIDDLLAVVNNWGWTGQPGGNQADVNNDGIVNIDDMLSVINGWGPCEGTQH